MSKLIQQFNKAWVIAKPYLENYGNDMSKTTIDYTIIIIYVGRLKIPEEYITAMPVISEDSNIAYLIPTTSGEGVCSTGLLDFLVITHNNFITYYHKNYPLAEKYSDE